ARFVAYRDALGLPKELTPHSARHSYVTHLTEDGVDRRFIQEAVGHRCDTSTAIYTHVSGDFMNTALRKALAPAINGQRGGGREEPMTRKLTSRSHLRQVMASHGMFAPTDLTEPLAQRGIHLSSSQVYRLVTERPERLSLKVLMALLDILGCSMDDLLEPIAAAVTPGRKARAAGGGDTGVGDLRPRRARITGAGE